MTRSKDKEQEESEEPEEDDPDLIAPKGLVSDLQDDEKDSDGASDEAS